MIWLLSVACLLGIGILVGLLLGTQNVRRTSLSSQESLKQTVEQAEWQLNQMTRAAFEAMTKAARQQSRSGWRE